MNLVDARVTKILSEPYEKYGSFWVDVEYNSEGYFGRSEFYFDTIEEAKELSIGRIFQV